MVSDGSGGRRECGYGYGDGYGWAQTARRARMVRSLTLTMVCGQPIIATR